MKDKTLTDNEIIKALECCCGGLTSDWCDKCPMNVTKECDKDLLALEKLALDLINRLQAENERLRTVKKHIDILIHRGIEYPTAEAYEKAFQKALEQLYYNTNAKAEAYKEFAEMAIKQVEKVRQKYQRLCKEQGEEMEEHMHIHFNGIIGIINNLLKETYTSSVTEATPSPPNKGEG